MNTGIRCVAVAAVLLELCACGERGVAGPPAEKIPPAVQAEFDNFVSCAAKNDPKQVGGGILLICGVRVHERSLPCIRHHNARLYARKAMEETFPGRDVYGFELSCPMSSGGGSITVQIEKTAGGHWLVSAPPSIF